MDESSPLEPDELPEELIQLVKPELQPGERMLWAAKQQPNPTQAGRRPWTTTYYAVAFLGLGAALFWVIFGPLRPHILIVEGPLSLAGVVAALVGVVAASIAIEGWIRRWSGGWPFDPMVYALTDRRAIIWVGQPDSGAVQVFSVPRGSLSTVNRLEYPDGSGNLDLIPVAGTSRRLEGVSDARRVEALLRRTLIDPGPRPSPWD